MPASTAELMKFFALNCKRRIAKLRRAVKKTLATLLALLGSLCPVAHAQSLLTNDLQQIIAQAVSVATNAAPNSVIAIIDREGFVLVVWDVNGGAAPSADEIGAAVSKAGTAAFLSSNQHAFSSRTAGFIILQHFPPLPPFDPVTLFPLGGVRNRPPGPLVGVQFSSLPHSDINFFKQIVGAPTEGGTNGLPVLNPGSPFGFALAGTPGGVPLYKNGVLVGGIGVVGSPEALNFRTRDPNERIALAGQFGYAPARKIFGSRVFIDGIRLPYIRTPAPRINTNAVFFSVATPGNEVAPFTFINSPSVSYPTATLGGVTGQVRSPIIDDPLGQLTAGDVTNIIAAAAARSAITRAGIRLPRGRTPARVFISVVNNPSTTGGPATVLGTFRTPDATIFSWDVAVQKARTAVFFSSTNLLAAAGVRTNIALSCRAVGFLAQSLYPPGIDGTAPGPFNGFQESISDGSTAVPPDPDLPNGITIFPGGFPLYNAAGELIGGIGISGDGVDQDDIIGAAGSVNHLPPGNLRSDRFIVRGARLPYAKFPRNPDL
jgi:uncharacterized protein GlcG (DUF336 family)